MSSPRVLVAEDSDLVRTLIARRLREAGYEVLEARDGAEAAIAVLREHPDVVITDLDMPVMDGSQLLHLLKGDPATQAIPVVVLTAHDEAVARFWGLQAGADAYLLKEELGELLLAKVQELAARARASQQVRQLPQLRSAGEVLARVARLLDASLLHATLTGRLLEQGVAAGDLHGTCRACLVLLSQVVDAHLLGLAVAEGDIITAHLFLPSPLTLRSLDRCTSALLARLPVTAGATLDVVITGDEAGTREVDAEGLLFTELPMHGAAGVLALLPSRPESYQDTAAPLVHGAIRHLALVLDNARLSERLRELSTLDGLTRLLNRRAIVERLAEELDRASRYGQPLAVLMCDLDHFKAINDTHGHLAGDAVLRCAAAVLRAGLRASDALGRYGGEEFLAVLPQASREAAQQVAERLRSTLARTPCALPGGGSVKTTGSFGVAALEELGGPASLDAFLDLADRRVYEAKAAGRNCVRP